MTTGRHTPPPDTTVAVVPHKAALAAFAGVVALDSALLVMSDGAPLVVMGVTAGTLIGATVAGCLYSLHRVWPDKIVPALPPLPCPVPVPAPLRPAPDIS